MNHTYDSLRELACLALTTPALAAAEARFVLQDALKEAGVWISVFEDPRYYSEWCDKWAMKAAYGAHNVDYSYEYIQRKLRWVGWQIAPSMDMSNHRKWSEERIAVRRTTGGTWRDPSLKKVAA